MHYYRGNFKKDYKRERATRDGWLIGRFIDDNEDRRTQAVAIKYWEFPKGKTTHKTKYENHAIECTFILQGTVKGHIDYKPITLKAGDYVVLPPKLHNNIVEKILKKARGLTIKAPSLPREDSIKMPR